LSAFAFIGANSRDEVPVQVIWMDEFEITPRVETLVFDDYVIVAQADEADDGDGENIDVMNANWCLIHPDDVICQDADEEDEVEGC
jgi:hypothetical protein